MRNTKRTIHTKASLAKALLLIAAGAANSLAQTPDFIQPATYPTAGSATLITVADFNRDGFRDIVTYESGTQILTILFGKADGTFQLPVAVNLGFSVSSMVDGDFNGDGKPDLALASSTAIAVLLNNGDGSFALPAFYSAGVVANYVTTGDINRDGLLDLVVAGGNGFTVLRNSGVGTFTLLTNLPQAFSHFWVGVADFNNDGKLDLVGDGSPSQFFPGNGDGTFGTPITIPTIPYGAVIGDFNGDGKMDIAYMVATFNQERVAGQQVALLMGSGDGQFFNSFNVLFNGPGTGQVAACDFDGDGKTDLAIWQTPSSQLSIMPNGMLRLLTLPVDLNSMSGAKLSSADVDGNGSKDLVLLKAAAVTVLRSTHGIPPLLAITTLNPTTVVGGSTTQGTVTLGGPAPAGGATVALSSSNPTLAYPVFPTVTIPAGASSTTFPISTSFIGAAASVNITGTYNFVSQSASLGLVAPFTLTQLSITPSVQFGGFSSTGTVTLSGPADSTSTVFLTSSNPVLATVPASITVPGGASSVSFPVNLQPVTADTPVTITASLGTVVKMTSMTVLRPLDTVRITRADDAVRAAQVRVEATSTSTTATLTVWNTATGAFIGTLSNTGGGKYSANFNVSPAIFSIMLKSSFGGITTGAVNQK